MGSTESRDNSRKMLRLLCGTAIAGSALTLAVPTAAFAATLEGGQPSGAEQPATEQPADVAVETQPASEQPTDSAQPAESATQSQGANDIIVTAQRRAERLQNVPISISNVSSEQLTRSGVQQVLDLPQVVPALRINYAGTFVLPTIRGVGSIVALPGLTQNIATYVDGFYVPTPSASNFNLVNVSSVNVLKGPQGTLFGANATGGAIQINTRAPQEETSILARLTYQSYNHLTAQFYGTTGIADGLAIDLAASYDRGDGWVTNLVNNDDQVGQFENWTIRTQILWEASPDISFRAAYEHANNDDPTSQLVIPRDRFTLGITIPGTIITTDSPRRVALNNPGYARREYDSYTLTSRFNLGFATLTSYTGYREDVISQGLDYDATSAPINFSNWVVSDSTFTQELNLASNPGSRFQWVIGGFYLNYKDAYNYNVNGNQIFRTQNETNSYAAFADATYEIVDNLFLTGGIRFTRDNPALNFNLIVASLTGQGDVTFENTSFRGVVRYQIAPNSNIYASFTQGYRSGGLPGSAFSLNPVLPENIDAWEIGYKTASGPLRLDVAGFYYNYRNIQVTTYGAGGASQTVNAAAAEIYGLDAELTWQVSDDFSLSLAGNYTHARYTDFTNALGYVQDQNPASPTFGAITTINVNATGFNVERTPEFAGSVSANYGFDLFNGRMALNANLFYTGSYFFDAPHTLEQDSYALLNLRATWTDPSDRFDISVFGTNVTNTEYFVSNFNDPFASRARYGQPTSVGVSFTFRR